MWQLLVKKVIISLLFGLILFTSQTSCLDWKFAVTTATDIRFFNSSWHYTNHRIRNDNHLRDVSVFAFDGIGDSLYYANNNLTLKQGQIYELKKFDDESHLPPQIVVKLNTTISGLVYDPLDGFLYWSDGQTIQRHHVKNNQSEVFLQANEVFPTDIALDICKRQLYYVNQHTSYSTSIEQINLDTRQTSVIVKGLSDTRSITIDYFSNKLYWLDNMGTTNVRIEEAKFDGTGRQKIFEETSASPLHLTTDLHNIYYSSVSYQSVIRIGKEDGMKTIIDYDFDVTPIDILVRHTAFEFKHDECLEVLQKLSKKLDNMEVNNKPLPKCKNNGIPNPETGKCICQSIYIQGDFCETNLCYNLCFNGGTCSMNIDHSMKCDCAPQFTGDRCETTKCHNFCMNGGVCSVNGEGEPICECTANKYGGERCEVEITAKLCKDHCMNNGNCTIENGSPVCACNAAFTGDRCENDKCHGYCLNNGTCEIDDGKPICACNHPYRGSRCEILYSFCLNGGTVFIKDGKPGCRCPKLLSGERCEQNICKEYCLNDGECDLTNGQPKCKCPQGVRGDRCEVKSNFNEILHKSCNGDQTMANLYDIDINSGVCSTLITPQQKELLDYGNQLEINSQDKATDMDQCGCMVSSITVVTLGFVISLIIILVIVLVVKRVYKPLRPKVKKTYVVRKNFTPLTSIPGSGATEQCEIIIEDCCNMNICETPCFDPTKLQGACDSSSNDSPKDSTNILRRREANTAAGPAYEMERY